MIKLMITAMVIYGVWRTWDQWLRWYKDIKDGIFDWFMFRHY